MDEFLRWLVLAFWSIVGGLVIVWGVGGYYHLRYYVLRRHEPEAWKCQPKRWLRPEQQRQAMKLSTMNMTIGGLLSGTFIWGLDRGLPTGLYFDFAERGWAWFLFSTVAFFLLVDLLAYYAHRAMHHKLVFRQVHSWHHRYVATTPFVVTAMHPVEFLTFQGVTFIPMFFLPIYYLTAITVFVYILVFNIIDHSGVRLSSRWPWQGPTTFHDDHHAHFHCNFGQCLLLWDRLHGTLRRKNRRYGADVYGGRGLASRPSGAEGGSSDDDFVRYK
ncbi:sterol desaturase family protein [Nannocystis punicea]|uniref:Sterol desaturase family protein n=1 Tax=Nannocystis punicea TaxID=2995304 RepID=A0ABY7H851_9BACT|nr:sterol desaturase family protein [Nannocystis poenicansa]WAS95441.1 sterol desaturase family protein [Nannocystis poenicansa]